ncbi:kinase-like domain-containing protein, partial [Armillaria borealis]
ATEIENPFDGLIQPYALHATDVYLSIPYGPPADVWNLGCFAFELVTYCWLFNPEATSRWSRDDDMLGQMISVNGLTSFPADVLAHGKYSDKYFDRSGKFLKYNIIPTILAIMVQSRFTLQPDEELERFVDMLSRMLQLRPEDRECARELLSHPWLQDA